ncbi:Vacuole membrane protein 1 [Porphyridium purpureum]|uniref:Vacuole membrane protein 1 n=1 Tax=Porphyridium purpureum TaxID=35688 RepID=A0A5J4YK41_PORPP|nr:Vacuole membrane protein 1 [Porphyridium purpureum]|eukprot:POR6213..scf210_14
MLISARMGSGLHTFVLYLAPHIARTTLIVSECDTLDFSTRRLDSVESAEGLWCEIVIPMVHIFSKVAYECFLWGYGTTLGELPPFF